VQVRDTPLINVYRLPGYTGSKRDSDMEGFGSNAPTVAEAREDSASDEDEEVELLNGLFESVLRFDAME
jgi:hypothetical protein